VETQISAAQDDKNPAPGSAANRSKQPKLGERSLIEHPTILSLTALNTNFNKDAKPTLMPGTTDRTMFMFTNDGVLALLAINLDHV
jgi:hypothetical protein